MTTNTLLKGSYSGNMKARKTAKSTARRRTPRTPALNLNERPFPNRINELCEEKKRTHDDIAAALGVNRTTVANWARGAKEIKRKWRLQLADFFGISEIEIFLAPPARGMRTVAIEVPLQAGDWAEQHRYDIEVQDNVVIPDDPDHRSMTLYGGRIIGESMNKIYPAGTIVVLSRKQDRPGEIVAGKRYHIRRTRGGQIVEETIKTLVKDARGQYWMKPESDSPEFASVLLDGGQDETVEIIGRVRYAVHRED